MVKKIIMLSIAMIVAMVAVAQPKKTDRALWKDAKKRAKEIRKEGWKIDGSRTLEEAFFYHYKKLQDGANQELPATVKGSTSIKTLNQAQKWAIRNITTIYAEQSKQHIRGRLVSETGAGIEGAPSVDDFYSAYENLISTTLEGEVKVSISLYREKDGENGAFDYRIIALINEEAASNARLKAMQRALAESEFARANAERISEFVREGFEYKEP
ncbi:MAG: hypothetical protein J6Q59_08425 [Paludibacteraceae bacterium]|nr:hypothetical protein [Paludibacteraceae bacterium]